MFFNRFFNRLIDKDVVEVVVHAGTFHADDVACVALLKLMHKDVKITRKFKVNIDNETADYILDIGRIDRVTKSQVILDHHQSPELIEGTEVKHCAFSKLVDLMINPEEKLFKKFFYNTLVLPVAAQDNGQNGAELGLMPSPLTFVNAMKLSWKDDVHPIDNLLRFHKVVDTMAVKVIENIIKNLKDKVEAVTVVENEFHRANEGVIILNRYLPWVDTVIELNAGLPYIQLVVFPNNRGGITVQVVPKKPGSFESWIKIPENVTEFEGCTGQAHGAFAFFNNFDDAVASAKKIVKNAGI